MNHDVGSLSGIVEFLAGVMPFSELPAGRLEPLARVAAIDFVPGGTRFIQQGVTPVDSLWVIQRGGVRSVLNDGSGGQTLLDVQGEGGTFGALAILRNSLANFNVETVEDSFFVRIPKENFLALVEDSPIVAQFYLRTLSEAYVHKAFTELAKVRAPACEMADSPGDAGTRLSLFATTVGEVTRGDLKTIRAEESIRLAADRMGREGVGSLVVVGDGATGASADGIVTDQDFRDKVVARGVDASGPVESIMSSPVLAVDESTTCFDALLFMMRHQVHHLGVRAVGGGLRGMVTAHDFLVLQGRSPFALFKDMLHATSLKRLAELSAGVPGVVAALVEEGARAAKIGRMVAVLSDVMLERLLTMLQQELGPPPAPFCWLVMGSEGRREQTIRTDQDNALVWQDSPGSEGLCKEYFEKFGTQAVTWLTRFGYPRCPGDIMASNPRWRMNLSGWKQTFESWVLKPEPEEVLNSGIFFDFRPVFGFTALGDELRDHVTDLARREEIFLLHMARDAVRSRPPLTFFKSFMVEKDGQHKDALDLKARGVLPLTEMGRVLALKHGVKKLNTLDRFAALAEAGHLSRDLHAELAQTYELLMQVRIAHQLRQIEAGQEPDNHVNPTLLTDIERRTLKEAFGVIGRAQGFLRDEFHLNQ